MLEAGSHAVSWSSLLPMWLRKHGFVFGAAQPGRNDDFVIAARGVEAGSDVAAGIYEGPVSLAMLANLGLEARTTFATAVELYPDASTLAPADPASFPGLAYGRDILRRIPAQRGEKSDPYVWNPRDRRLAAGPVAVQVFEPAAGWRVLALCRLDDTNERRPVVVSNGRVVLLGLPLFDLVGRKHWMPPIEHGYYGFEHDPFSVEAELWLARLVRTAASEASASFTMLDPWPGGHRAALTVRFDHDRDISPESLSSLLDLLDRYRVKASWGFLARLTPAEQMAQVLARGHEIVLHTEAPDRDGLLREVRTFRESGWPVKGVTAHGGIGSAGHLGQTYFEWAANAGLGHADILSRDTHAAHPAVLARGETAELSSVYLPPVHYSLDRGTAPDAHYLDDLLLTIPTRLATGGHVTIMNHPDIHRLELERLLSSLALDKVWTATHGQAVEWSRATRFGWYWTEAGGFEVSGTSSHDVAVRATSSDGRRERSGGSSTASEAMSGRPAMEAAPEIAMIVPPAGVGSDALGDGSQSRHSWTDLARHLLTCLGLPQVAILESGAQLPASIHAAVAFGPEGWMPTLETGRSIDLWLLDAGAAAAPGGLEVVLDSGQPVELPAVHSVTVVGDGRGLDDPVGRLQQVLFWLGERLAKGSGPLLQRDFREWRMLLRLAHEETQASEYWTRVTSGIERRRPSEDIAGVAAESESGPLTRKAALASPDLLVEQAIEAMSSNMPDHRQRLVELVRDMFAHSNTGYRLVAAGLSALLLGDQETARAVRDRLDQPEWRRNDVAFPFLRPGGPGFCYSPLVAAWHLLQARRADDSFRIPDGIGIPAVLARPLPWCLLHNGALADRDTRSISRSLADNWRTLHSAPCPMGSQYKLDTANYRPLIAALEKLWLDVFRLIQNGSGRPLARLRPWPAPYRAAVSMRYDVDRPVSAERISELVGLQSRHADASFGSWYYFVDDPDLAPQAAQLHKASQEVGRHLQSAREAVPGIGVTHHSAPTSDYWRGDATSAVLDQSGVSYGEFLAAQMPTPRPAWISEGGAERLGRMWLTTIYFPLEGDTGNRTLAYFDRLADEFRAILAEGGHAIVGSHPDIDQQPLADLLQREDFSRVWFATVGDVVERCRRVLEPGAVHACAGDRPGTILIRSKAPLSDVVVELWHPQDTTPDMRLVQLTEEAGGFVAILDVRIPT